MKPSFWKPILRVMRHPIAGFALAFFAMSHSFAALDIELTQGVTGAIPIAIVPFATQPGQYPGEDNIANIIHHDLRNSGRFQVLKQNQIRRFPTSALEIASPYWREQKVDYVLVGRMSNRDDGRIKIHLDLVDIYSGHAQDSGADRDNDASSDAASDTGGNASGRAGKSAQVSHTVVLSKDYTSTPEGLRRLAHRISDEIYYQLTGEKGIFSTRIAYVLVKHRQGRPSEYQLQIADFDGENAQALLTSPEPIMSPAWAPDARRLAYVSFERDTSEVYVQAIESGARQKIASFKGINSAPAWSPDGKKLAVVLSRTGKPKIYILELESRRFEQLTHGESIDTEPFWMPDGKSILFTSNRGGGPQIYKVALANHKVERLTYDGNYNASVDISHDGKTLAYLHQEGKRFTIAVQNLRTGLVRTLTKTTYGLDESPSLSPNGRLILYATQHRDRGILALISVDGLIQLRLPAHDGNVQEPAWSPYLG